MSTTKKVLFAALFAVIATILILVSRATSNSVQIEAENGTLTAPATVVSDSTASGGKYLQFGSTAPAPAPQPPGNSGSTVDATTLDHKFMLGYQGWFQCPTDGSPSAAWRHWFSGNPPTGPLVDFWPDVSELSSTEKCDTGLKLPNGSPAYVFSDYNAQTVARQFQWMQTNNIDGVMLQRFVSEISNTSSPMLAIRNKVTDNVKAGAEATGRAFDVMYDITGQAETNMVSAIENDYLNNIQSVTSSSRYLHQNGKPVVVIWGFGFSGRNGTPADLSALLTFFHNHNVYVMGGVDNDWRTNTTWASTFTGFDAISPWMVGRVNSISSADNYKSTTAAELAYAKAHNQMYMPVIFPGYSFHNQNASSPLNSIPRLGGTFLWEQAYNDISAGATTIYGAMFDEMNEGTAFFKQANSTSMMPTSLTLVSLNADGYTNLPTDWYLRLSGQIGQMVRGQIPLTKTIPISPTAFNKPGNSIGSAVNKGLINARVKIASALHAIGEFFGHLPDLFASAVKSIFGTPKAHASGDPVIVAAGDIACDPSANTGAPNHCDQGNTANLIKTITPQAILTLGDNQYESNTSAAYSQVYDPTWGAAARAIGGFQLLRPAIGNHEYLTANATGYFGYFGSNAGPTTSGYYSWDLGSWHFLSLNSECSHIGGCGAGSPEDTWVKADLAAHPTACTLAYWHEPRFSSGQHGDAGQMSQIWNDLVSGGADVVLSGHNHDYERFQKAGVTPTTTSGSYQAPVLDSNGIMEFVIGTGGKNHYGFGTEPMMAGEVVRDSTSFGVIKLTLHAGSYDWQFMPETNSGNFTDSGSSTCSGSPTPSPSPQPPSDTTAPTVSISSPVNGSTVSGTVNISTKASDNVGVSKVNFLVDGAVKGTVTTGSSGTYNYSWNTSGLSGSHTLTAQAYDAAGNIGTSAGVTVTVSNGTVTCANPDVSDGSSVVTISAPITGTYHVWSRMMASSSTNNSYVFQTDGNCNVTIGGSSSLSTTSWTWVNYKSGNTATPADISLTAGSHSVILASHLAGVKLDRVMLLTDTCIPSGTGDNCVSVNDTTPPTVSITAPANNASVSGKVTVSATASDTGGSGLAKVNFSVDGALAATSTASPYGFTWDTSNWSSGNHTIGAIAYDGAGNASTQNKVTVNVQLAPTPTDTTPPGQTTGLVATAASPNQVNLSWNAATDNVGVVGYYIVRNGQILNLINNGTSYSDTGLAANTNYSYQVMAVDGAGNKGPLSAIVSATTPAAVSDTTPPSQPTGLSVKIISPYQVNLSWDASTDSGGSGLAGYIVTRNGTKVANISSTTYGDATLSPNTSYSYAVQAVDGAGNKSTAATASTIKTPSISTGGGSESTKLTLTPAADAWIKKAHPKTNFGKSATMRVDAHALENLLIKFNVSGIGSRHVVSAKLYLYNTDSSTDGGKFYNVSNRWSEGTVTWDNAPAFTDDVVAKLGSVHRGTWTVIDLTSLITHDATYSLRAKSSTSDGAAYHTKEARSNKPKLVIMVN